MVSAAVDRNQALYIAVLVANKSGAEQTSQLSEWKHPEPERLAVVTGSFRGGGEEKKKQHKPRLASRCREKMSVS